MPAGGGVGEEMHIRMSGGVDGAVIDYASTAPLLSKVCARHSWVSFDLI